MVDNASENDPYKAKILDTRDTGDGTVFFHVDPFTRGQDLLATIRFAEPDTFKYANKLKGLLRAAVNYHGYLTNEPRMDGETNMAINEALELDMHDEHTAPALEELVVSATNTRAFEGYTIEIKHNEIHSTTLADELLELQSLTDDHYRNLGLE